MQSNFELRRIADALEKIVEILEKKNIQKNKTQQQHKSYTPLRPILIPSPPKIALHPYMPLKHPPKQKQKLKGKGEVK